MSRGKNINTDHCTFDFKASKLVCSHCGAAEPVTFPLSVEGFAALSDEFVGRHRFCTAASGEGEI